MDTRDDYLLLSGLQHFAFCPRQWALRHIEQQWQENYHTILGEIIHQKAHDGYSSEKQGNVLLSRGMPVYSDELKIRGVCDIVEFQEVDAEDGVHLHGRPGFYRIYPVEYKKGKPKETDMDILQLTAQCLCLEEMFHTDIADGAIYYAEIRRREKVQFTQELRERVQECLSEMNRLFARRYTPRVRWFKGCKSCSMQEICLPELHKARTVKQYLKQAEGDEA